MNNFGLGTLTIVLDDINDHDPQFNQPFYRRSVPDNSKQGASIVSLLADDSDFDSTITYGWPDRVTRIGQFKR